MAGVERKKRVIDDPAWVLAILNRHAFWMLILKCFTIIHITSPTTREIDWLEDLPTDQNNYLCSSQLLSCEGSGGKDTLSGTLVKI